MEHAMPLFGDGGCRVIRWFQRPRCLYLDCVRAAAEVTSEASYVTLTAGLSIKLAPEMSECRV